MGMGWEGGVMRLSNPRASPRVRTSAQGRGLPHPHLRGKRHSPPIELCLAIHFDFYGCFPRNSGPYRTIPPGNQKVTPMAFFGKSTLGSMADSKSLGVGEIGTTRVLLPSVCEKQVKGWTSRSKSNQIRSPKSLRFRKSSHSA